MTAKYSKVTIVTYGPRTYSKNLRDGLTLYSVSREGSLTKRIVAFVLNLKHVVSSGSAVLAAGAFIETYISSILFGFTYVAKVPGDIVWERARNNGRTSLGIEEFQQVRLGLKYRAFRFIYTRSLKRARKVIVPSLGLHKLCLTWGVSRERLELVHNGIDVNTFSLLKMQDTEFDVVTVCRLTTWKGVDELINSCARNNLKLLVVGDGPDRTRLEVVAKTSGAAVTFKGDVDADKIPTLLSSAKTFVLNSYYEGLPHALLEARAAGLFSIARADTGSAEVIHNQLDGLLVDEFFSLDAAFCFVLEQPGEVVKMIDNALADTIERFDKFKNYELIYFILEAKP